MQREIDKHLLVTCKPCGEIWSLAKLPFPVEKLPSLTKKAKCPACGSTGRNIFIASAADAAIWAQRPANQARSSEATGG